MKRMILILLALCLALPAAYAEETTPDYLAWNPWICSAVCGVVTADTPVDMKDDFYLAVNKETILNTEIPAGYGVGGPQMDLDLQLWEDLDNLLANADPETHDGKLAADLYGLFMDWDTRNALGVTPLKEKTDLIEAAGNLEELSGYMVNTPAAEQPASLVKFDVGNDITDSSRYVLIFQDISLLMDDSAEYAEQTEYGDVFLEAYGGLARKILMKMGCSGEEADGKIANCLAFERLLAPSILTKTEQLSPDVTMKVLGSVKDWEALKQAAGAFPLTEILEKAGCPAVDYSLAKSPDYIAALGRAYTEENLALIKDYLIVSSTREYCSLLDRDCYEWGLEASGIISGSAGDEDDGSVASWLVAKKLAWPTAQLYCSAYAAPEDKERISALTDRIIDEYRGIISGADFLSGDTKAEALEKLDSMGRNTLYPDDWTPYCMDGLEFASAAEGGNLVDAAEAIKAWETADSLKYLDKTADQSIWLTGPLEVNCCYSSSTNTMYILAAFARGAVYSTGMREEELLGGIGMAIAHEISHAFDANGSQYDKDGNMIDWWTEEDYAAFLEKNQRMADYYSAITVWDGMQVDGTIVTGEACADMGGIKCMLRIASGIENFDYDLFFRSYAQLWAEVLSPEFALMVMRDPHPFSYIRVNTTLQQFDEFLDCYGIREGDGMYLAPENRVNIW